ncbi:MAG: FG-GAP-like repeat-containing protein, partial [Candidatus Thorarchaeota archaeon]
DLEIVTGSDETWGPYQDGVYSNGVWRTFDSSGNLEWQRGTQTDEARSSPVIIDIDGDGDLEIAGGTTSGWYFQVMDHQGDFIWAFPKLSGTLIGGNFEWPSSPAAADLDSSVSGVELVIGNRPRGNIWCFDGDNTDGIDDGYTLIPSDFSGWPYPLGTEGTDWDVLWKFNTGAVIFASPAIGDVDNDGKLEVVIGSTDSNIYVLDGATGALECIFTTGGAVYASAALADLDGDGYLEIIIGSTDNTIYCFQWGGGVGSTEWMYSTSGAVYSSAAIGDIDNDGGYEIVVGSNDGNVYTFNILGGLEWIYSTGGAVYSSPALAERCNIDPYDKDWPMFRHNPARTGLYGAAPPTSLDIYIGSDDGFLHLIEGDDGTEIDRFRVNVGWYPSPQGGIHTSPVVADVDGDKYLEIFFYDWGQGSIYTGHTYWALEDAIIRKEMSSSTGGLGTTVHITLHVGVPSGVTVKVIDILPDQFTYIPDTFEVNGISASPTVKRQQISYTITDPCYHKIEFDAKVTEAKWEDWMVYNLAKVEWYKDGVMYHEKEITEPFVIEAFEELQKYVGLPKADVVFAIDLTGSMWDEIDVVKAEATNIMNDLATQIADVQFGLVSFMDYYGSYSTTEPGSSPLTYNAWYGWGGDYPYKLDQDITDDVATMTTKIQTLSLGNGMDGPQDYTRIIHESWNSLTSSDPLDHLNWREDTERFLILFGDNVPHDTNFDYDNDGILENTGGDPGRDAVMGTVDDLNFETEVQNAADHDIHIMAVYSGYSGYRYPWEYMATITDGGYYELSDAEDIPDAIIDFIEEQIGETLTIEVATETQWALVIEVTNPFSYTMTDTRITDRFGAEIEIDEPFPSSITHGTASYYTKGKSAKVFLTWDIGDLLSGETARLILLVSTDLNPAGHQEYTSSGIYDLNSGATLKFIDPEQDMQLSAVTDSIDVEVYDVIIY